MPADRPSISVINDNPEFLELMRDILDEDAGYRVTTFHDGETSLDDLVASEPDLVIVDLLLGGASGWEIVALARADERLKDIPVIVCSADVAALRERAGDFERIGKIHVLAKPFGIEDLTSLVQKLVGRATPESV